MIDIVFFQIKKKHLIFALLLIPITYLRLKFDNSISFFKIFGTGKGQSFSFNDANLYKYGFIFVRKEEVADPIQLKLWNKVSKERTLYKVSTIAAHGKWGGVEPFNPSPLEHDGKVVTITRARIKIKHQLAFWKHLPDVVNSLHSSAGLLTSFGIGELPIGLQGTFSVWENEKAVKDFAFRQTAHSNIIRLSKNEKWFSEELFARFALIEERVKNFN
jgi:hypothetical protein